MRPLDRIHSIKAKLSIVILASIAVTTVVSTIGWRTSTPVIVRIVVSAAIVVALVYPFSRGITAPLREMVVASTAMADGDYSKPVTATSRDEVGELARAFDSMRSELEAVDRQRRDLVANVAHELRTPIAALRARFENIVDGVEVADRASIVASLAEVERLGTLVDQLLDLSRIESGGLVPDMREFDVVEMLRDAAADFSRREGAGVVLADPVGVGGPLEVLGDPMMLRQVVDNLIQNSLRYSPGTEPVQLSARRHQESVEIAVADRGPGIPETERRQVFERFYRTDHGRSSDSGGAGLGLSIASAIADVHHATIAIESNQPSGCRAVLKMPTADRHHSGRTTR